ncbi:MAG: hypothetical protein J6T88_04335 [Bacteroidales bacterium]|nr:hypothetical protein [Bacteroidales bacterium]
MIESFESFETTDKRFELNDIQKQLIDEKVNQIGGEDLLINGDLEPNRSQVIEIYDAMVTRFRPDIKTAVNLSPMKTYNSTWDTFVSSYLESPYLEAFSDKEQIEVISDYMTSIEDIRFEKWKDLTEEQRLEVLNNMEQMIAKLEHRPAVPIFFEKLTSEFGYQQHNPMDTSLDKIAINTDIIVASGQNPELLEEVLDTLIHEGRHRYQHYNVEERLVHESKAEVDSWRENFEDLGYADGSPVLIHLIGRYSYTNDYLEYVGERLYYYQPTEIDARNFASDVMSDYHKKMEA